VTANKARRTVHRQQLLCRVLLCRVSLGTRQRKVTVTAPGDGDGAVAECHRMTLGKRPTLCRVSTEWLTRQRSTPWGPLPGPLSRVLGGTQQRLPLCRVPVGLALGKGITNGPLYQFLCRVHWMTLGKEATFVEYQGHITRQSGFTGAQVCLLCRVL
jgi:hypothetical protein